MDPEFWLRPQTEPSGDKYYSMVFVYVEDILHLDHSPGVLISKLEKIYRLKEKPKAPYQFLGANIDKVQLSDVTMAWSMSSQEYLRNAITNLEQELE